MKVKSTILVYHKSDKDTLLFDIDQDKLVPKINPETISEAAGNFLSSTLEGGDSIPPLVLPITNLRIIVTFSKGAALQVEYAVLSPPRTNHQFLMSTQVTSVKSGQLYGSRVITKRFDDLFIDSVSKDKAFWAGFKCLEHDYIVKELISGSTNPQFNCARYATVRLMAYYSTFSRMAKVSTLKP